MKIRFQCPECELTEQTEHGIVSHLVSAHAVLKDQAVQSNLVRVSELDEDQLNRMLQVSTKNKLYI